MDYYLKERARDPSNFNLSEQSPVMKAARAYAEERLFVPSEDSLRLRDRVTQTLIAEVDGRSGEASLQSLPAPSSETPTPGDFLSDGLLKVQGEGAEVMGEEGRGEGERGRRGGGRREGRR